MGKQPVTAPLRYRRRSAPEIVERARKFRDNITTRRSVRHFSSEPVPLDAVRMCIESAASAPSGANKQPWSFVVVTDLATRHAIREAAEEQEQELYSRRASQCWLDDLAPLGTGPEKLFLDTAPLLIAIFAQKHGASRRERHYYVNESVGIAVGILIAALHDAGLATLTYTPSPMSFLLDLLDRPDNERSFLLIPVGFPARDCQVPLLSRKPLSEVLIER